MIKHSVEKQSMGGPDTAATCASLGSVSARPEFCLKILGSLANLEGQNFFMYNNFICLHMRRN